MKKGIVYLVGAGPGDPGLITVKARELIQQADCLVYDFLANPEFLNLCGGEVIYVGKQGSDHTLSQEKINRLLVEKAGTGKTVVRLKGGDPFIFGRGGEEAEELVRHGIDFQIVPGVSSFYAAPAYAGIPVTHRDYASSFAVITGHRRADSDEEEINYPEYNPGQTCVFLMGMKNLRRIANDLIREKGFPASTPAAVIAWGTTPRQATVAGRLENIADKAAEMDLGPPAIILVGGVVNLRGSLRWYEKLPLYGKRIAVTRTREQASVLSRKLSLLGAEVIEFPTITIVPRKDTELLHDAFERIGEYDWLVFTSQNAVGIFFRELWETGMDSRSLHGCKTAAIGIATAREMERYGIRADLVPPEFVAESLLDEMKRAGMKDARVLLPCAGGAREALPEGLAAMGAVVDRIPIYDAARPEYDSETFREQISGADIITFTSSSTATNFFSIVSETNAALASIGPITSGTIRSAGFTVNIEAREYTIDGLIEAIITWARG